MITCDSDTGTDPGDTGTSTDGTGTPDDSGTTDTEDTEEDFDEDGCTAPDDRDDQDPAVHPGALELCSGIDDDCDGNVDQSNTAAAQGTDGTWTDRMSVEDGESPVRGGACLVLPDAGLRSTSSSAGWV